MEYEIYENAVFEKLLTVVQNIKIISDYKF